MSVYIDSHGLVHTSLAALRAAERGYK